MPDFDVRYVYCNNLNCPNDNLEPAQWERFCDECGKELSPAPQCDCGREINVKYSHRSKFCGGCGKPWTNSFVMGKTLEKSNAWRAIKVDYVSAN